MTNKEKYCGVIVPMVTPLEQNTKIDKSGVENVVEGLVKNQCNAFILGTTGEASSLDRKSVV